MNGIMIQSRLRKLEDQLGMGKEPVVIMIVDFSGGPLPRERHQDGSTVRYVKYEKEVFTDDAESTHKAY